jgi:diguanylate cyclase (GGDEF)-like protein/PAS domain S-box-containing protein
MASRTNKGKDSSSNEIQKLKPILFRLAYSESIVENLPEAVVIFDPEGLINRINSAFTEMFGYSAEEAIGQNVSELLAPDERKKEAHSFRRIIKKGKTINAKTVRMRKDGTRINVSMKSAPVIVEGETAGFFVVYRDITPEKLAEKRLIAMATTDSLTGLFNRRHFFELSNLELARSRRNGNPLVMLMMDIDHFKNINDTFGHQAGDTVLETLARFGRTCIRAVDVFGRIGGEEFAILLPETKLEDGVAVAERLRHGVERMQIDADGATLSITVSIGVACALAGSHHFDEILAESDRALYKAKCNGRNRVCTWCTGNGDQKNNNDYEDGKTIAERHADYATLR